MIRAQRRQAWRYYKETRLRDRARQVAKVVLRDSSLAKPEALTQRAKQKIKKKSKVWFQKDLSSHKINFRTFFATLRCHKNSTKSGAFPKRARHCERAPFLSISSCQILPWKVFSSYQSQNFSCGRALFLIHF